MNGINTYQSLDAYRSHELSIQMRTSSGDVINMDFANQQALSMEASKNGSERSASFSFASLQSYQFSMETNGIDEQDKKEIEAFMEIAQPYIDNFMKELESGEQHTPMNKAAKSVSDVFAPINGMPEQSKHHGKDSIVKMMDRAMENVQQHEKLIDQSQKFLDQILKNLDEFQQLIYA
jgi:hypothetical protein